MVLQEQRVFLNYFIARRRLQMRTPRRLDVFHAGFNIRALCRALSICQFSMEILDDYPEALTATNH